MIIRSVLRRYLHFINFAIKNRMLIFLNSKKRRYRYRNNCNFYRI